MRLLASLSPCLICLLHHLLLLFFVVNDTATTEIYTLSLHDALPISDGIDIASGGELQMALEAGAAPDHVSFAGPGKREDRKSTRLNSSH